MSWVNKNISVYLRTWLMVLRLCAKLWTKNGISLQFLEFNKKINTNGMFIEGRIKKMEWREVNFGTGKNRTGEIQSGSHFGQSEQLLAKEISLMPLLGYFCKGRRWFIALHKSAPHEYFAGFFSQSDISAIPSQTMIFLRGWKSIDKNN